MKEYKNVNNNININPYKLNSLCVKRNLNLQKKLNRIKQNIVQISNKIKSTDEKINNSKINNIPTPIRNNHKRNVDLKLKINSECNNQAKNLSYQYSNNNTIKSELKTCNSTSNILFPSQNNNINNINNFNFNNNIFSKSTHSFNPRRTYSKSNLNLDKKKDNNNYIYKANIHTFKPKEICLLNEVLQKQLIDMRLQLYDSEKKTEKFCEIIKNLKNDKDLLNKNLFQLNEELNSNLNLKNQMINEIKKLNDIIEEKNSLIQNLNAQIGLMININSFQNEKNNINNDILGDENSNNDNNIEINDLKDNINYYKIKNTNIKRDINNLKKEFDHFLF